MEGVDLWWTRKTDFNSNGTVRLKLSHVIGYPDRELFVELESGPTIWLHIGEVHDLTEGGRGSGVSVEGYWLYRQ